MPSASEFAPDFAAWDLPALAVELAATGRIRLAPALPRAAAELLRAELAETTQWSRTFRQGAVERELAADELGALTPPQLAALESFARADSGGGFRFLHDAIRISSDSADRQARGWAIDWLVEALNAPATLAAMGRLTAEPITHFEGDATRYLPGHFLTLHDDGRRRAKRVLAAVLSLSGGQADWQADWGGVLQFHDTAGDIAAGWVPRFNSLALFAVPQPHSVSQVSPLAPRPRLSIAGWFYAD